MNKLTNAFLIILMGCTYVMTAVGQPNLDFRRIVVNWPEIQLYFSVECNGQDVYDMQKQHFRIEEEGVPVTQFTLSCVQPTSAISAALVFDASGSMSGAGNAGAKQAGRAFIDLMDGILDEATIIWFNTQVNIQQQMTTIKPLLYSAVDALPAGGGTAVWDGTYAGIVELINNGVNTCRAVVVVTDGADNSSSRTPSEIISLAGRHAIRVYTVSLGTSINAAQLEMIATLTGGKYYPISNAGQLASVYGVILAEIRQCVGECKITYEAECADSTTRGVELFLENYCSGSVAKTKTYRAPLDSTDYTTLSMNLAETHAFSGTDVTVPWLLQTPLSGKTLHPMEFKLYYDSQYLTFKNISATTGSLLQGMTFETIPVRPGEVLIRTTESRVITGSGLLASLTFSASVVTAVSCSTPYTEDVTLTAGCTRPEISAEPVCLYPPDDAPLVFCSSSAPRELRFDAGLQDYTPNPFQVCAEFTNNGTQDALQGAFQLEYDTTLLELLSQVETFPGVGTDVATGQKATACYTFRARWQPKQALTDICVTASFNNHADVRCCERITLHTVGVVLNCSIDVPDIEIDWGSMTYTPMPFPVTVTVTNSGLLPADNPLVTLNLGAQYTLEFSAPDSPATATKALNPVGPLPPGSSATASYMLRHPLVDTTTRVELEAVVSYRGERCVQQVVIPGIDTTSFRFQLYAAKPLEFCEGLSVQIDAPGGYDSYLWNTGDTTRSIFASKSGPYFCTAWYNGQFGRSDTLYVNVLPAPRPIIAVTGSIPLCPGDSLILDAGPGYAIYFWNTRETTQSIVVRDAGEYWVNVTGGNGCPGVSDTVTVSLSPIAEKPIITRDLDVLSSTPARTWQWYRNGQPLSGETNRDLQLSQTGTYVVFITDENGCKAMSDPFDVSVLDIESVEAAVRRFDLYPNPVDGKVSVDIDLDRPQGVVIMVTDMLGRIHALQRFTDVTRLRRQLDLTGYAPGPYIVRLSLTRGSISRLLTVQ